MTPESVREYAEAIQRRYLWAKRDQKGKLLDEFCLTTGYHRKAAIRLLGKMVRSTVSPALPSGASSLSQAKASGRRSPGHQREFGPEVGEALRTIWQKSDYLCSRRLQPFLSEIVRVLERHGELALGDSVREQVLKVSPATIDRLLRPFRAEDRRLRQPYLSARHSDRPKERLKGQIPIRTFADWESVRADAKVGYLEADLVVHCGESTLGFYLHTLDMVDIVSGWTELVALFGRHQERVGAAVDQVKRRLPFPLRGVDCDNGSEFINQGFFDYCRRYTIEFTRSRPYRKNDQAHVEERNWFVVRRLVGYDRYSTKAAHAQLTKLYELVQKYVNFFWPIRKIVTKERVGAKVKKRYDQAKTPYQRLLESGVLTAEERARLEATYLRLNPVRLRAQIELELDSLWELRERSGEAKEATKKTKDGLEGGTRERLSASGDVS
jgi:hypothetical protein